jgi:uncharacterized repeat protein (TIGR03803 family)
VLPPGQSGEAANLHDLLPFDYRVAARMKTLARFALSIISATASFLAGCGGSQPPIGAPFAMPKGGVAAVEPEAPICGVRVMHAFTSAHNYRNGWGPDGLTLEDGTFVGTTYYGGRSDHGTVYTLTPSGHFELLYSFKGSPDGYGPFGLTVYNGNYYGLTNRGGAFGNGSFFEITPSGQERVLYSFRCGRHGEFPVGWTLYNGKFYGTTYYGGLGEGYGTVFELNPNSDERILHRFGARKNDFAGSPGRNLYVLNGILYGTAGTSKHGWGTIFSLTTSGHYANIHTFTNSDGGASNIWAYQGALYGTTRGGWMGKAALQVCSRCIF